MARANEEENTIDTIRDLKRRDPFLPFLVILSSGDRFVIDDPDALAVSGSQLHYYPPRTPKSIHIRVNQIVALEELGEKQSA